MTSTTVSILPARTGWLEHQDKLVICYRAKRNGLPSLTLSEALPAANSLRCPLFHLLRRRLVPMALDPFPYECPLRSLFRSFRFLMVSYLLFVSSCVKGRSALRPAVLGRWRCLRGLPGFNDPPALLVRHDPQL